MAGRRKTPVLETVFNSYRILGSVGQGGSGTVYRVRDEAEKEWAAKVLSPAVPREKVRRFKSEIHFCARNQHPNIVTVVDYGFAEIDGSKTPFYVMQLFEGSLRRQLEAGLPSDKALPWFSQILDGVEAAHLQHVVHRDLKPENILLDAANSRLLVANFGIASFEEEDLYTAVETKDTTRLANFVYSAPEQRSRGGACACSTDIYALGLMLNEMMTGEVPQGTGYKLIGSVVPELAYLDTLVEEMLRQSHEKRIQTVDGVKASLIGHRQSFVARQKLSELRGTVVPETDLDDPLVLNPLRLVATDWDNSTLTLTFSQFVNEQWIWALQHMGSYSSVMGYRPEAFSFLRNIATVAVDEQDVVRVVETFRQWLPLANQVYKDAIARGRREAEAKAREALEEEVRRAEARERVLKRIQP